MIIGNVSAVAVHCWALPESAQFAHVHLLQMLRDFYSWIMPLERKGHTGYYLPSLPAKLSTSMSIFIQRLKTLCFIKIQKLIIFHGRCCSFVNCMLGCFNSPGLGEVLWSKVKLDSSESRTCDIIRTRTPLGLLSVTYERHRSIFRVGTWGVSHLTQHLGVSYILCDISHQGDFVYVIVTYDLWEPCLLGQHLAMP